MEESREAFFQQCQELGVQPKEAVEILKRNGINERYTQENHKKYLGIITAHAQMLHQLIGVANKQRDAMVIMDPCPICGMPVENWHDMDGLFGGGYGWRCTNPEQGLGHNHFFQYRLEKIRPWMQRNQGMSDPETSSEICLETVCPSGESLMESSSYDSSQLPIDSIGPLRTEELEPDLLT